MTVCLSRVSTGLSAIATAALGASMLISLAVVARSLPVGPLSGSRMKLVMGGGAGYPGVVGVSGPSTSP